METFNKTFTIQWVGPFKSLTDLQSYFKDEGSINSCLFNLYMYEARKDNRHKIHRYIGIHKKNDGIEKRLDTRHEHLANHLDDKGLNLWIGSF